MAPAPSTVHLSFSVVHSLATQARLRQMEWNSAPSLEATEFQQNDSTYGGSITIRSFSIHSLTNVHPRDFNTYLECRATGRQRQLGWLGGHVACTQRKVPTHRDGSLLGAAKRPSRWSVCPLGSKHPACWSLLRIVPQAMDYAQ